jgi:hypothetical protein
MYEIYDECPKCQATYDLVRIGGDNEQQLYFCESCGWEKIVVRPFHVGGVTYLLYVLGEAAIKHDLPFLDEVGFITNFRERQKTKIHSGAEFPG